MSAYICMGAYYPDFTVYYKAVKPQVQKKKLQTVVAIIPVLVNWLMSS